MIYGPGCKGNYPILSKAAKTLPFFPDVQNQRSMLFVGNLCVYVKRVIDSMMFGVFFPQNKGYVCTSDMVRQIAKTHGKKIHLTKVFNPLLRLFSGKIGIIDKVFGSMVYEQSNNIPTEMIGFSDSIALTEGAEQYEF
jgi:UDP-glucose 4-epimerase